MTSIQTLPTRVDDTSIETELPHDFYREIHKGIRYAMFHTTMHAGSVDVGDADQVDALLERCAELVDILHLHHHHEDGFIDPLLETVSPELRSAVEAQHVAVDAGIEQLTALGRRLADAGARARNNVAHQLYLDLSRFAAVYLDHQLYEETVVMPALCDAIPVAELETIHRTLLQSIPLDVFVDTMGVMLPAMNIGERSGMLGGLSMAPADVFDIVRHAAESILTPVQFAEVANRIGLH